MKNGDMKWLPDGRLKIMHSDREFISMPDLIRGWRTWPADEFIVRHRFTPKQGNRIREENPDGIAEGSKYTRIAGLPSDFPAEKYMT